MSEQQIKQIMTAMEEQNKVLSKLTKDGEDRAEAYGRLAVFLKDNLKTTNEKLDGLSTEVQPIIDLATSVRGFDKVGMWIVKLLLGIGALIGALTTILYFLRKLIIPSHE